MKKLLVLFLIPILILGLVGCDIENRAAENENATLHDGVEVVEPLTFYSFDSLTASIEEMRGNATEDIHNLGGIERLYIPAIPIQEMMLEAITVKERYVCIYYYLDELDISEFETSDEEEIARIANTVKLEWIRNADGEEMLVNTVEQFLLTELSSGIYYYDITYPTQPDTILAQSFFWVQDGYMFNLDVPYDACMSLLAQDSIDTLTGLKKIELRTDDSSLPEEQQLAVSDVPAEVLAQEEELCALPLAPEEVE